MFMPSALLGKLEGRTMFTFEDIMNLELSESERLEVIQSLDDEVGTVVVLDKEWMATLITCVVYQHTVCKGPHCSACAVRNILWKTDDPALYSCVNTRPPTTPFILSDHLDDDNRASYQFGMLTTEAMKSILKQYYASQNRSVISSDIDAVVVFLEDIGVMLQTQAPLGPHSFIPALAQSRTVVRGPAVAAFEITTKSDIVALGPRFLSSMFRLSGYSGPQATPASVGQCITPEGFLTNFILDEIEIQIHCNSPQTLTVYVLNPATLKIVFRVAQAIEISSDLDPLSGRSHTVTIVNWNLDVPKPDWRKLKYGSLA